MGRGLTSLLAAHTALFPAVIGRQGTVKADLRGKALSQFSQRLLIPTPCSTRENSAVRREEKRSSLGFFFFFF